MDTKTIRADSHENIEKDNKILFKSIMSAYNKISSSKIEAESYGL